MPGQALSLPQQSLGMLALPLRSDTVGAVIVVIEFFVMCTSLFTILDIYRSGYMRYHMSIAMLPTYKHGLSRHASCSTAGVSHFCYVICQSYRIRCLPYSRGVADALPVHLRICNDSDSRGWALAQAFIAKSLVIRPDARKMFGYHDLF